MNKVFVDSSVLFAGVVSAAGHARDILNFGESSAIHLICSTVVVSEVERNLQRKFASNLATFSTIIESNTFEIVDAPEALILECAQLVHPKDAPIIAAAAHARADWLATFDRQHLLRMRAQIARHYSVAVAEPRDILATLGLKPAG